MSIEKLIYRIQNHIIILGYNPRVERIVEELSGEGLGGEDIPVLIVSNQQEPPPAVKRLHVHFFSANPTKEDVLKKLSIEKSRAILIVAQSEEDGTPGGSVDARTVLSIINLQRYFSLHLVNGHRPRVIAECMEENTMEHLKNAGCDEIIMIGTTSASLLAASIINPGITNFFGEVFSTLHGNEFYISSPPEEVVGCSFLQALKKIKVTYGDILVAVKRDKHIMVNPRRCLVQKGDQVVVLSRRKPNYAVQAKMREETHGNR